ncbi:hypothetical protein BU17DRAFT_59946 [Hysterangium stoloniferum]|nr:hypothetical protein BU17DRAFT_59946 [Hysterangium stoloniferum]
MCFLTIPSEKHGSSAIAKSVKSRCFLQSFRQEAHNSKKFGERVWVKEGDGQKVEQFVDPGSIDPSSSSGRANTSSQVQPTPAPAPAQPPPPPYLPTSLSYSQADEIDIPGLLFSNQSSKRALDTDEDDADNKARTLKRLRTARDPSDSDSGSVFSVFPSISPLPHLHENKTLLTSPPPPTPSAAAQIVAMLSHPSQLDPVSVSASPLAPSSSGLQPESTAATVPAQSQSQDRDHPLPTSAPHPQRSDSGSTPQAENEDTFWFSHLTSYHHWLQMGRAALERLGIEEETGLDDNDDDDEKEAVKGSG